MTSISKAAGYSGSASECVSPATAHVGMYIHTYAADELAKLCFSKFEPSMKYVGVSVCVCVFKKKTPVCCVFPSLFRSPIHANPITMVTHHQSWLIHH